MNTKQTYLAWVRSKYPQVYWQAIRRTFSPKSGMSGLGDDLTTSITPDLSVVGAPTDLAISSDTSDAINSASATAQAQPSTDWFGQLANAINQIAPTVVQTQAAQSLIQINAQRAAMNLPLYDSNGRLITGSSLSPTSASIAQMEASLSANSSWILPALLAVGVGALLLNRKSR